MILLKTQRVIAEVRMQWCTHVALPESPTVMFTTSKRPRPTMRYPSLRISLNPVRSSIVQDLRLLPIDSSLVYLAVSEYILFLSVFLAGKCVFQVMSINKSMSSNKKLLSLVKLVKLFVSCIQKCYPSKNFRASAPNPAGGLNAPQTLTCKAPPFTAGYAPD